VRVGVDANGWAGRLGPGTFALVLKDLDLDLVAFVRRLPELLNALARAPEANFKFD
jgi:hypothetical protein